MVLQGRQCTGANTTPLGALNPAFTGQARPQEGKAYQHVIVIFQIFENSANISIKFLAVKPAIYAVNFFLILWYFQL